MRALTYSMPPEVDTFAVTLIESGIPVTKITLARDDIEELEFELDGAWATYSRADISDATSVEVMPELFPRFDWRLEPYVSTAFSTLMRRFALAWASTCAEI